jgi:hypothetical protein
MPDERPRSCLPASGSQKLDCYRSTQDVAIGDSNFGRDGKALAITLQPDDESQPQ